MSREKKDGSEFFGGGPRAIRLVLEQEQNPAQCFGVFAMAELDLRPEP